MALESTDRLVTVIGASGFIGRYVVQNLCRLGVRVRAVCRHPETALFLKPLGGLGQVEVVGGNITRAADLPRLVAGSAAVINLVGILKGDFETVQAEAPGALAKAARDAGAEAFVQISAIGADPESPARYGRTKAEGEARVKAAFPKATIIRPSIVFGAEDNFVNRFARLIRLSPVVPVVKPGVLMQPVWVGDVGRAVALAAAEPGSYQGKTFELAGPRSLTFQQLIQWIADCIRCRRIVLPLPDMVSCGLASLDFMPGAPITKDHWLMLQKDNVPARGAKGLEAFGIAPSSLESIAPGWLVQYREHGRFHIDNSTKAR